MRPAVLLPSGVACALLGLAIAVQDAGGGDGHADFLERLAKDGRSLPLENVEGNECLECHAEIGEEWRHSTHATAWQDELYQKELKKVRRKKSCHGCHIPEPLSTQTAWDRPIARSENEHLGVDCKACHLDADGETILGPWGNETSAHPTKQSDLFGSEDDNRLCIACHATNIGPVIGVAKDFVDTEQVDLGLSCVGCHMPAVRRPAANDPQGETEYPVRKGRSHRLMTPRDPLFLRKAFILDAEVRDGATVLSVENQCGHRVPGLLERKITLKARVLDREGEEVASAELVIDNRAYLPVEDVVELVIEGVGASLELEGFHEAPGIKRPFSFLQQSFVLGE